MPSNRLLRWLRVPVRSTDAGWHLRGPAPARPAVSRRAMRYDALALALVLVGGLSLAAAPARAAPEPPVVQTSPDVWNAELTQRPRAWYAGPDARVIADAVVAHQSIEGGWPKNTDLIAVDPADTDPGAGNTFDNDAFILPMTYLALVADATGDQAYVAAFDRGLSYALTAQYPNGGWPQFYPLRSGYYSHVTFNDDAMVQIMTLLRQVAQGEAPFGFVSPAYRERVRDAVSRGLELILRTQIVRDGRLTVWCAQYDETTLEPAWARRYEPPSLSGSESVGIVRYLMQEPDPSPQVIAAIEGAVAWLEANAMQDVALERFTNAQGQPDRRLVPSPGHRLWARFYDLETRQPVYMDRDSVSRGHLADIEHERRNGYNYVGSWPERLLTEDYPRWRRDRGLSTADHAI